MEPSADHTALLDPALDHPVSASTASTAAADSPSGDVLVEDELLVEEISIDGMCGVY